VTAATYTKEKDDQYRVKLTVDTKKIYYDGLGNESGTGKGREYYRHRHFYGRRQECPRHDGQAAALSP
jgi:hypothetical protein